MIVADTNLIAYLIIPGPLSKTATEVFRRDRDWSAPHLWRSEMRNVLLEYVRKRGMPVHQAVRAMDEAINLIGGREYLLESSEILETATSLNLSAYDAEFVALARKLRIPLISSDKKITASCPAIALTMEQFLSAEQ